MLFFFIGEDFVTSVLTLLISLARNLIFQNLNRINFIEHFGCLNLIDKRYDS